MAIEARHLDNIFFLPRTQPQLISNSGDFITAKQGGMNVYNTTSTPAEVIFPAFYQSAVCDGILPVKSDSGVTTFDNGGVGAPRKRARDSIIDNDACLGVPVAPCRKTRVLSVNQDISALDIHRQHSELDRLVDQHTHRMRLEMQEKVRRQSEELLAVIQEGIVQKLREKDDDVQRLVKMNFILQERIKALCMENQLVRGLAQTSEATANSLRSNLEQVLAHTAAEDRRPSSAAAAVEEEAESCCGSSGGEGGVAEAESGRSGPRRAACRGCGEKEPCVLLLPCRHLSLCTACGSVLHGCPVCGSVMTGTVHVNMS